ncbi:uncharacterized protein Z518_08681 [Rhinocladiella mackenziei CBS 650.93]|uniref:Uncharacterized protein n=1 Tax=Rhinocladiella mackenziei CBS 650.93 TaxID=1442369 RepID=A0A0D2IA30_9EURO|nr:uncharacterized protein Z518_08681 [Rhinocladiella mackenziei CBS 650.93]KIX02739.1 hypothetical protein Z518_08681 [Rhinocladiella mackenziei CBS 650.93]
MPKPKAFLKQSKAKKKAEQVLETADDFQAAGVDFEEAAGKWRAGDAVKSMRFFSRAIEVYDQGLTKFPSSLDLAYNKSVSGVHHPSLLCWLFGDELTFSRARVLLEMGTDPILANQLQIPLLDVLQQALDSHRYALSLDQENPDTLFNTAQVLTAIAEAYAKDPNRADQDALQPLEEALELQNRCLAIQELNLEEFVQRRNEAAAQIASANLNSEPSEPVPTKSDENHHPSASDTEDQWVSIVEPVTKDTLIETILAALATLTTLCSVLGSSTASAPSSSLGWIEEFSSTLINTKLPVLLEDAEAERIQEVVLTRAIFVSALLEAGYRLGSINPNTYKRERDEAFRVPELDLEKNFAALVANANSLMSFNAALADDDSSNAVSLASQRWNALSAAIANMAAASKISGPVPEDIAETHFIRGNCSLLQYQLGQPPVSYQPSMGNATQLLKNADIFYRNATKLYQDNEQKAVSQLRAVVSQALLAGKNPIFATAEHDWGRGGDWAKSQIEDMVDDGLILPTPDVQ